MMGLKAVAQNNINNNASFVTATSSYQALATDNYIYVNNTSGAGVTITFPASPASGQKLIILDVAGNAGTYAITLGATIDGQVNPTLNSNYQGAAVKWTGTIWKEEA